MLHIESAENHYAIGQTLLNPVGQKPHFCEDRFADSECNISEALPCEGTVRVPETSQEYEATSYKLTEFDKEMIIRGLCSLQQFLQTIPNE